MKRLFAVFTMMLAMFASCTAFASTDISEGKIVAEGIGALGQEAVMGYRAARADAYRNLLESVQGVQIDSETSVQNAITTNDVIKSKVNGIVKGAKVVNQYQDIYGYHVVIEAPVYGTNSIAAAVIAANPNPAPLPAANNFAPAASVKGTYTGVIVDCTGLELSTAMAPAIFTNDGQPVYGSTNFSDEFLIKNGCVGYARSLDSGVERAGANPLVIKAVSVRKFVCPVISNEDAGKILAENTISGFLADAKVVFVR